MACSRKAVRALAFVLAVALVAGMLVRPVSAWAAASLADRVEEPVQVANVTAEAFGTSVTAGPGQAESLPISRFCPMAISASTDPVSIEAGIDCGMVDMCGIEPCLCGSADAWGGCSCNGLQTLEPTISYTSSDESVVRVEQAWGRTWLVPVGPGTATLSCTASLKYFEDTTLQVAVEVGSLAVADAALAGTALAVLVVVVLVVWGIVRLVARKGAARAEKGERS